MSHLHPLGMVFTTLMRAIILQTQKCLSRLDLSTEKWQAEYMGKHHVTLCLMATELRYKTVLVPGLWSCADGMEQDEH